jgi:hypothetical protein
MRTSDQAWVALQSIVMVGVGWFIWDATTEAKDIEPGNRLLIVSIASYAAAWSVTRIIALTGRILASAFSRLSRCDHDPLSKRIEPHL